MSTPARFFFTLIAGAALAACSVEPTAPAGQTTPPPPTAAEHGALRGSVLDASAGDRGIGGVLIGFRSASDYHMVSTASDGTFLMDGLPTVEWRAELQLPAGRSLAPGETGTRVALVRPERTMALTPFRLDGGGPATPPTPGPATDVD